MGLIYKHYYTDSQFYFINVISNLVYQEKYQSFSPQRSLSE
ncbi:hypothetical protein KSS87_009140 [Heliosperma pusillum]|nr:hypothetical protein KSS87_009140 [Heliosperma pusillum]